MNFFYKIFLTILIISFTSACKQKATQDAKKELAKAYNETLYLSDMEGMFPENATRQDSLAVINAYIDRWVRNKLMMVNAEKNIPAEMDIEKMVNDYRQSLILSIYEKKITDENLNLEVNEQELRDYYDKSKEQFQLESPILRGYFLKLPRPTEQIDSLQKWWNNLKSADNLQKLRDYTAKYRLKTFWLSDSIWHNADELKNIIQHKDFKIDDLQSGKEITLKDDEYQYFLKINKMMDKKEIAPFEVARDQILKVSLHQRKIKLLEQKKQELFEAEMKKNNVKIFDF